MQRKVCNQKVQDMFVTRVPISINSPNWALTVTRGRSKYM